MRVNLILILGLVATICDTLYAEGELLLKSGFEPPVRVTDDMGDIEGADQGAHQSWESTRDWIASSRFVYLVGRDKNLTDYMASFITQANGPSGSPTHVLCMQNSISRERDSRLAMGGLIYPMSIISLRIDNDKTSLPGDGNRPDC